MALGAAALVVIGAGIWRGASPGRERTPDAIGVPRPVERQRLVVCAADVDAAATGRLKEGLSDGAMGEPEFVAELDAANAKALLALGRTAPKAARDIESGKAVLYRLHVLDFKAQDGDVIALFAGGVSHGVIPLANAGTEVLIPLARGTTAEMQVVATGDGGGGVTFGMASSLGEARTRVLQVGDSEKWWITVK
jgi:hypothetical protein